MPSTMADDTGARGSGRTTAQIRRAPVGAFIVTPHLHYSRDLAMREGRADIKFVSLDSAKAHGWSRTRGVRGADMVMLDHACWQFMTRAERAEFFALQSVFEW